MTNKALAQLEPGDIVYYVEKKYFSELDKHKWLKERIEKCVFLHRDPANTHALLHRISKKDHVYKHQNEIFASYDEAKEMLLKHKAGRREVIMDLLHCHDKLVKEMK